MVASASPFPPESETGRRKEELKDVGEADRIFTV